MHVIILAHGEPPSRALLAAEIQRADLFIATDGAANDLPAQGVSPDVVLGDFDSLEPAVREKLAEAEFVDAWDQDASDLEKAISYALSRGATSVTLLGAGGRRLDHTLTAISLLLKYSERLDIRLVDDLGVAQVLRSSATLEGRPGDTLSLIPFERVEGVCESGVKWPLEDATLLPGSHGVSNQFTEPVATVSVRSGAVIVCHLKRSP